MQNDKIYRAILDLHEKHDRTHASVEERLIALENHIAFNKGVIKAIITGFTFVGILIGTFADGVKAKIGTLATSLGRLFI